MRRRCGKALSCIEAHSSLFQVVGGCYSPAPEIMHYLMRVVLWIDNWLTASSSAEIEISAYAVASIV